MQSFRKCIRASCTVDAAVCDGTCDANHVTVLRPALQLSSEVLPVQVRALLWPRVPGVRLAAAQVGVPGHSLHPPQPPSRDREAGGEAAAAEEEGEERGAGHVVSPCTAHLCLQSELLQ